MKHGVAGQILICVVLIKCYSVWLAKPGCNAALTVALRAY